MFSKISSQISLWIGSPVAFFLCLLAVLGWSFSGTFLGYDKDWLNLEISLFTVLMTISIQASQNRDTTAINQKLDELIKVTDKANDSLIEVEKKA